VPRRSRCRRPRSGSATGKLPRGCGCGEHPAFPAPSIYEWLFVVHGSGADRVAGRRIHASQRKHPALTIRCMLGSLFRRGAWLDAPEAAKIGCAKNPISQAQSTLILLSSPSSKNISLKASGKSLLQLRSSRPRRGTLAIVTNVGRDAVDAFMPEDERHESGRRSRVVLISRR
jgi:hypothetical protein